MRRTDFCHSHVYVRVPVPRRFLLRRNTFAFRAAGEKMIACFYDSAIRFGGSHEFVFERSSWRAFSSRRDACLPSL